MKRSAEADPGVSAPFPANIKMEDIDYGKTKITYLTKSKDTRNKVNPYAQYKSKSLKFSQNFYKIWISKALALQNLWFNFLLELFLSPPLPLQCFMALISQIQQIVYPPQDWES